MWAAIAYRRAQAFALVLLSALITACAVFAPLYERALEQSLLRDGLTRQGILDTAITASSVIERGRPPSPQDARSIIPPTLTRLYDGGSDMWSSQLRYVGVAKAQSIVSIVGPQDVCRGLQVVQGACPAKPFEVAVSEAEAKVQGWPIGAQLQAVEDIPTLSTPPAFPQPFVVTAFFRQLDDQGHWTGIALEGRAGTAKLDPSGTPLMDGWVTPPATFSGWRADRLSVTWLLDRDAVSLDRLESIPAGVASMRSEGNPKMPTISIRSNVSDLVAGVVEGQHQARTIVPLLVGQLAVLAVVVLGLAAGAAVEQRRPELALARLRGRGPGGAARMVMLELGVVVAAGVPLGFGLAVAMNEAARRFWLAPGVPFEVPGTTYVASGLALVAAVAAVAVVARPTLREPISTLLRRVPPRRRGRVVGVGDAIVVAVAAAGVVTLASGNLTGPLALATPTLLALAVGLTLAHVLVPLANLAARRFTGGGHLVGSLTAIQVSRRPAVRRILAIITVATALTVFATDALVVGARNREERARVETGAEAVLTTTAGDVTALRAAVRAADPAGANATPVVTIRQGSTSAVTTLAVDPGPFSRIAELPRDPGAFAWASIDRAPPPEVIVRGRTFSVTVAAQALQRNVAPDAPPDVPTPALQPNLVAFLAPVGSAPFAVPLGVVPAGAAAPLTFTRDLSCTTGCRVAGFGLTTPAGFIGSLRGRLTVGPVTMDGGTPALVGDPTLWLASGVPDASEEKRLPYARPVDVSDPTRIGIDLWTAKDDVRISSTGVASSVPALVLGPLPADAPGPAFQAAGLDGTSVDMTRVGSVPYAPGGGGNEAIASIDALAKRASQIGPLATAQVFVADPATVAALTAALRQAGVDVRAVTYRADRERLFDSSASAWGLRLALVVGIAALLLAAIVLVLVAATSWRGRSRDLAALRMAGMSVRSLTRMGLAEQWTVIVVSVAAGVACGLVGAGLAMPIVPFFTVPSTVLPVDLTPAAGPALLAAAVGLATLLAVGAVVGARLVRRATLSRLRDQL